MLLNRPFLLAICATSLLHACGGDDQNVPDDAPINQTKVIFSPATSAVPVPSDLQFSAETAADGTMNAGVDPANPVITGIDSLDGNSVLAPFDIKFDGGLDDAQTLSTANFVVAGSNIIPNSTQNVFLLPLTYPSGDSLSQASISGASVEVPTFAEALAYQTAVGAGDTATLLALAEPVARAEIISLDGGTNNTLRINPIQPLQPKTKYLVVVTNDVRDRSGNRVAASEAYEFIKDPETDLDAFGESADSLVPLRAAIQGWETLAAGYFSFMQTVFDGAGVDATAPSVDDVIFSMTFTTAGTTDVLTSIAAPESFFETSLISAARKDAIVKLVSGVYGLDGTTTGTDPNDDTIAGTINAALTTPGGELYNATVATSIGAGADYATIASADTSAAFLMQLAAAEVSESVNNGDGISFAAEAVGTVQAMVDTVSAEAGFSVPASSVFPIPADRASNFYRVDTASTLSPSFPATATIHQGDITLPYYQEAPDGVDLSPLVTSDWEANATIGALIDGGSGNPAGTTPPSDKVTYRYPFPTQQSLQTIPIVVTTPNDAVVATAGITRPADGWPAIIFSHGITSDRSTSLPMASALASACVQQVGEDLVATGLPCFATIAIDQPLHGVAPAAGPDLGSGPIEGSIVPGLFSVSDLDNAVTPNVGDNTPSAGLTERHFDAYADASLQPIPMDYDAELGSSGGLFINLNSFSTVRDNLRQMTIDLLNVAASIDTMDLDDDGTANELDPNNLYFIGHSLGAIDGLPFVAVNNSDEVQSSTFTSQPRVKAASGLVTGGGVIRLLTNSPSFAATILGGLAAASDDLAQGTSGLETYLNVFQGVVDSADITNFASSLSDANSDTGILLTEVVGDGTEANPSDQTIPNAGDPPLEATFGSFLVESLPAPLSGTEPMVSQFGAIPSADADATDADPAVVITRFNQGSHGTPVSADNIDVFTEMVSQIALFFAQDGIVTTPIVSNTDVIAD